LFPNEEHSGTQSAGHRDHVLGVVLDFLWSVSRLDVLLIDSSGLNRLKKPEEEVALLDVRVLE
jgi:hypothetical protein